MDCTKKKILIIKQSSLGDVVHTLPLAHALKRTYPTCTIGWVVQKPFAQLLACDPSVDHVHVIEIPSTSEPGASGFVWWQAALATLSSLKKLRSECRQHSYDILLDLHASFRSGLLALMNSGGVRVGFKNARELNTFFQNKLVEVPDHVKHALEKNLLFCGQLGCTAVGEDFYMNSREGDAETVRLFLEDLKIGDAQNVVYANPCARWQTKFWPAEYWAALADQLYGQEIALILAGSVYDQEFIGRISAHMKSKPYIAAGKLGLTEAVALLQRSSVYVGLDSGPMHMAAMTGTPVVALFGPTHPERVGPYGVRNVIVRNEELDCLGCRKRQCSHLSCMKGITVKETIAAVLRLINSSSDSES